MKTDKPNTNHALELGDKPDNLDESTGKLEKPLQKEPTMREETPAAS